MCVQTLRVMWAAMHCGRTCFWLDLSDAVCVKAGRKLIAANQKL